MAQFGRALRSGRRGRGFKSRHLDYEKPNAPSNARCVRFFICRRRDLSAEMNCVHLVSQKRRRRFWVRHLDKSQTNIAPRQPRRDAFFFFVVGGSLLTVLTSVKTLGRNLRFLRPAERSSTREPEAPQAVLGSSPRLKILMICYPAQLQPRCDGSLLCR